MRTLETMTAEELAAQSFPPPTFIVENLIPIGMNVLGGAGKIGKSWMMLWLALRVAQGKPVWERQTMQCDVLYLCLEDTFPRIQRRMAAINETPAPGLHFAVQSGKLHDGLEEQITEHLCLHPETKLIIIDTLKKVRECNEASYAGDYDDVSALKAIADERNISIVVVHHLRKTKDKDDPFNELIGSNGVMGAVDTAYLLKKGFRGAKTATLLVTGRDVEDQELVLRFENCVWELVEERSEEEMQNEAVPPFLMRIVAFMQDKPCWEGTATELLEAVGETELKPTSVVRCLGEYYYELLQPQGIRFDTKRTGQSRLICLTRCDGDDTNDEDDANDAYDEEGENANSVINAESSQPSLPSQAS